MLVDANLLLYAVDSRSAFHDAARSWLEEVLNGPRRVAIPWQSLVAFLRISTNPRALDAPLQPADAWAFVEDWLAVPAVWVPQPAEGHAAILGRLIAEGDLRANLIPDAVLAALCIEHGLTMCTNDSDFARFDGLRVVNPLRA
jgi:toxin-antitoxin system PIN domain toxin